MLNKLSTHPHCLAFVLGLLSVFALPPYYILPLLFVTLSGLLLLINQASNGKQAFATGYWFGFGFFAFGLSWVGNALLIDWQTFGWLYPLTLLAAGAFFGLFIGFPAFLAWKFKGSAARYLAFTAFWVIFEWLRSFFLTGFPWNLLGSVLVFNLKAIQAASLFGTYGLSLCCLLVFCAPFIYIAYRTPKSLLATIAIIIAVPAFLYGYGSYRLSIIHRKFTPAETTVRLVQPAIPQSLKWNKEALEDNFRRYINLSRSQPLDNIDFVIWGETASPFALDMDKAHMDELLPAIPPNGYLVTGTLRYEFDAYGEVQPLNSMLAINPEGLIEDFYDKAHLVPFGEYIPLKQYLPDWIRPVTNVIGQFKPGSGPKVIKLPRKPSFGGSICYEIIFPGEIVDRSNRPEWLINVTNDGWYGDSAGPYQHLATTRLRAVEEGLTIARSANTGISALIAPTGMILGKIPLNSSGILDLKLPNPSFFSTTYGHFGNVLPLILCFLNITLAFYLTLRKL